MNKQLQTLKKVYYLSFQILHKLRQGFAFASFRADPPQFTEFYMYNITSLLLWVSLHMLTSQVIDTDDIEW